mgnify:CR=1 FL=1
MSYLNFVKYQREIIRNVDFKGAKITRNYLDILFYISQYKAVTVSQIARELLHTNYIQVYQIIQSMRNHGLINYFRLNDQKVKANWIILTHDAESFICELNLKFKLYSF